MGGFSPPFFLTLGLVLKKWSEALEHKSLQTRDKGLTPCFFFLFPSTLLNTGSSNKITTNQSINQSNNLQFSACQCLDTLTFPPMDNLRVLKNWLMFFFCCSSWNILRCHKTLPKLTNGHSDSQSHLWAISSFQWGMRKVATIPEKSHHAIRSTYLKRKDSKYAFASTSRFKVHTSFTLPSGRARPYWPSNFDTVSAQSKAGWSSAATTCNTHQLTCNCGGPRAGGRHDSTHTWPNRKYEHTLATLL